MFHHLATEHVLSILSLALDQLWRNISLTVMCVFQLTFLPATCMNHHRLLLISVIVAVGPTDLNGGRRDRQNLALIGCFVWMLEQTAWGKEMQCKLSYPWGNEVMWRSLAEAALTSMAFNLILSHMSVWKSGNWPRNIRSSCAEAKPLLREGKALRTCTHFSHSNVDNTRRKCMAKRREL